jgi:hypothetical protein
MTVVNTNYVIVRTKLQALITLELLRSGAIRKASRLLARLSIPHW